MATTSDETVVMEASDLECPVCGEYFADPKLLPCAHLVCRSCLTSLLQQERGAACPLCRCAIATPPQLPRRRNGRKVDADTLLASKRLADQFPSDESMAGLVEATLTLSGQHVCCACVHVAAVSLCLQCGDMFCRACTTLHQRQSLSKHHDVENLGSLTAERLAAKRRIICDTHSDKMCELFCPAHGRSICHLCAASKHRGCSDVKDLEERTTEAREVLKELLTSLSDGERKAARAIKEVEEELEAAEQRAEDAKREIAAACERLENSVKVCGRRLIAQLLNATSGTTSEAKLKKSSLVNQRVKLTSHKNAAQRIQERPVQRIDMATVLKTRVADLDPCDGTPGRVKVVSKVTLAIDQAVLSRLEKEISELGHVYVTEEKTPQLRFNTKHGTNIQLSDNQQTAERVSGFNNAIVLSQDPMEVGLLYTVQVDDIDVSCMKTFHIGVVTQIPDTLPCSAGQLSSAILVSPYEVLCDGWEVKTSVGAGLNRLTLGSCIGLWLDKHRGLHLSVNGRHQGQVVSAVADPCYVMFDLGGVMRKVTALPVTKVPATGARGH